MRFSLSVSLSHPMHSVSLSTPLTKMDGVKICLKWRDRERERESREREREGLVCLFMEAAGRVAERAGFA